MSAKFIRQSTLQAVMHLAALSLFVMPAVAQGIITPQGLTRAGAGGPVTGTIPNGATYPTAPPINNSLSTPQGVTTSIPPPSHISPGIGRIPSIKAPTLKPAREKMKKDTDPYKLIDGGTPSIMIEENPH